MLYVDQPIGTGFSYGTDDVSSTVTAAPEVWKLIQAFYAQFPQYKNRDFGIFTESYGGHYGPEFASYIQQQNSAIAKGTVTGEKINLIALGVNNGWYDPIIQYKAYIDYAYNNSYNQIISSSTRTSLTSKYNNDCVPALKKCPALTGTNSACVSSENTCASEIEDVIFDAGDYDVYDVRAPSNDPNPPETYVNYLSSASVKKAIGATSTYSECPNGPYQKFSQTGDDSRSTLATLSSVVQSGIQVVMWAGDADMLVEACLELWEINKLTATQDLQLLGQL
jgi:carboxypeptidase C (cathepsin A)